MDNKLTLLIECDNERKVGTFLKIDTEENNQKRLEMLDPNNVPKEVKGLIKSLGLPIHEIKTRFTHHLIILDEDHAKVLAGKLIQYSLNPKIYDFCHGNMTLEQIELALG